MLCSWPNFTDFVALAGQVGSFLASVALGRPHRRLAFESGWTDGLPACFGRETRLLPLLVLSCPACPSKPSGKSKGVPPLLRLLRALPYVAVQSCMMYIPVCHSFITKALGFAHLDFLRSIRLAFCSKSVPMQHKHGDAELRSTTG